MSGFRIKKLTTLGPLLMRFFSKSGVPFRAKLFVMLGILYIIFPFDLIPDIWPLVGWIEDIIIGFLTFRYVQRSVTKDNPIDIDKSDDIIDVTAKVIDND